MKPQIVWLDAERLCHLRGDPCLSVTVELR
jgi:hypothetical protein